MWAIIYCAKIFNNVGKDQWKKDDMFSSVSTFKSEYISVSALKIMADVQKLMWAPSSHTNCTVCVLHPFFASTYAPSPLPIIPPPSILPFPLLLLSSALALIQCVPTYCICSTPSFTPSGRGTQVLYSLALFTQTKSYSVSVTKPAKSLWFFHVLSAHGPLLSPGHWPGPWIQWARGNGGRLKECASINLIMTWWLRSPW